MAEKFVVGGGGRNPMEDANWYEQEAAGAPGTMARGPYKEKETQSLRMVIAGLNVAAVVGSIAQKMVIKQK